MAKSGKEQQRRRDKSREDKDADDDEDEDDEDDSDDSDLEDDVDDDDEEDEPKKGSKKGIKKTSKKKDDDDDEDDDDDDDDDDEDDDEDDGDDEDDDDKPEYTKGDFVTYKKLKCKVLKVTDDGLTLKDSKDKVHKEVDPDKVKAYVMTAEEKKLEEGDTVEYLDKECEITKISPDGTSLTLKSSKGKVHKAVGVKDVEKVDKEDDDDSDDEDDDGDDDKPSFSKGDKVTYKKKEWTVLKATDDGLKLKSGSKTVEDIDPDDVSAVKEDEDEDDDDSDDEDDD